MPQGHERHQASRRGLDRSDGSGRSLLSAREEAGGGSDDARVERRGCLHSRKDWIGRHERRQGAEADAEAAMVAAVRAALGVWLTREVNVLVARMGMRCCMVGADRAVMFAAGGRMAGRSASHDGRHCTPCGEQERKQQHQHDAELLHARILSRSPRVWVQAIESSNSLSKDYRAP